MLCISAQVSVYPLRQSRLSPALDEALGAIQSCGLDVHTGPMSSLLCGGDDKVFQALKEAFRAAAGMGDLVMVVTLSNACPATSGTDTPT